MTVITGARIQPLAMSDWQCRLNPHTVYRPRKGDEPNAFHRFMQWLCFGVRWERVP